MLWYLFDWWNRSALCSITVHIYADNKNKDMFLLFNIRPIITWTPFWIVNLLKNNTTNSVTTPAPSGHYSRVVYIVYTTLLRGPWTLWVRGFVEPSGLGTLCNPLDLEPSSTLWAPGETGKMPGFYLGLFLEKKFLDNRKSKYKLNWR